ncbi:hypothetical protein VARV_BRZ66_39_009.7 [Variola virus]|uniref:B11R protein n=1 Tax=Variola virus TaxID=10255 RepID=Q89072_VARV|nr:B12R [Variola virus]CAB54604.1 B11R protein [Variola minor virus]ABF22769.1 hypothetical protein VARV_BEN68_59_009.7 [Variola virus]ABF23378.1 hypothetical protein VARV_BRZ66_39_009.7 [Variola virus]ABF24777.1 hypothetical protein VARV_GUI69_005_009.7 [Variola virus]
MAYNIYCIIIFYDINSIFQNILNYFRIYFVYINKNIHLRAYIYLYNTAPSSIIHLIILVRTIPCEMYLVNRSWIEYLYRLILVYIITHHIKQY